MVGQVVRYSYDLILIAELVELDDAADLVQKRCSYFFRSQLFFLSLAADFEVDALGSIFRRAGSIFSFFLAEL